MLEAGKIYTLQVSNSDNVSLEALSGYVVEVRPMRGVFDAVLRPENIALKPGTSVAVPVTLLRREQIEGDVELRVEGLPAGVTAAPAKVLPEKDTGYIVFTAAPGTQIISANYNVIATAKGTMGVIEKRVVPQMAFQTGNGTSYREVTAGTLTVAGTPDYEISFSAGGPLYLHPRRATPVKVKIKRRQGFTGTVYLNMIHFPNGWTCDAIGTNETEATLNIRPDGNDTAPYLKRDPKLTMYRAILEGWTDEFHYSYGSVELRKAEKLRDDDR